MKLLIQSAIPATCEKCINSFWLRVSPCRKTSFLDKKVSSVSEHMENGSVLCQITDKWLHILYTGWPHFWETKFPEFSLRFPEYFKFFPEQLKRAKFDRMHFCWRSCQIFFIFPEFPWDFDNFSNFLSFPDFPCFPGLWPPWYMKRPSISKDQWYFGSLRMWQIVSEFSCWYIQSAY